MLSISNSKPRSLLNEGNLVLVFKLSELENCLWFPALTYTRKGKSWPKHRAIPWEPEGLWTEPSRCERDRAVQVWILATPLAYTSQWYSHTAWRQCSHVHLHLRVEMGTSQARARALQGHLLLEREFILQLSELRIKSPSFASAAWPH